MILVGCESQGDYRKCIHLRDLKRLKQLGVDVDNAQEIIIINNRRKIVFFRQGTRNRFKAYWKPGMPMPNVGKTVELKTRIIHVVTTAAASARIGTRLGVESAP